MKFVSRDVIFQEHIFPFQSTEPRLQAEPRGSLVHPSYFEVFDDEEVEVDAATRGVDSSFRVVSDDNQDSHSDPIPPVTPPKRSRN